MLLVPLLILLCVDAVAQPDLQIDPKPITWNVIGLKHNNVNVGPNKFPVGVRVKNTGNQPATGVNACLELTGGTGAAYISIFDSDCVTTPSIAPGATADFYFIAKVQRTTDAFNKARDYKITISADAPVANVMKTGQLYVEKLIDQNRNVVLELMGPQYVTAGEVRTFVLTAETTPQGYGQLTCFVDFPNTYFRVLSVNSTYSSGGNNDKQYADACGWDHNPASPTYMTCIGPTSFNNGRAGGNITSTYKVEIVQNLTGPVMLCPLILDFSGSSYHYNADFGADVEIVEPNPSDIAVVKSDTRDPVEVGTQFEYLLTVMNMGETTATDVVLTDTLPMGVTFLGADPVADSGPNPLLWNIGELPPSAQVNVTISVEANCDGVGTVLNEAGVITATSELTLVNNFTSETTLIVDAEPPVLLCPGDAFASAAECETTAAVQLPLPTATDNCTAQPEIAAGVRDDGKPLTDPYPVGITQVTWTATDDSDNAATCTILVVVEPSECNGCTLTQGFWMTHPDEWPVDSLTLGNRSYSKNELLSILGEPVQMNGLVILARQLIASKLNIANGANPTDAAQAIIDADALIADLIVPPVGTDSLLPSEVMSLVEILDDYNNGITGPGHCPDERDQCMIECPRDIIINVGPGECGRNVPFIALKIGYCPGSVVVCDPEPGHFFPVGTTVVTCRVVHPTSGILDDCSFTVTVNDVEPPLISCPEDFVVDAEETLCSAVVDYTTTVSDNCTTVHLSCTPPPGSRFDRGINTVTCVATDAAGNATTCTFTINVRDSEPPVIVCPENVVTTASGCETTASVELDLPVAGDNCDPQPVISSGVRSDGQPLGAPFPLGVTTVTWTATDQGSNATSCTATVQVLRGLCPEPGDCLVICPDDIAVDSLSGQCGTTVSYQVDLTGQCDGTTVVCTPPPGSFFSVGTTQVTCQVLSTVPAYPTHGSEPVLISECFFTVTVRDVEPPLITCPSDITVSAEPGQCDAVVTWQLEADDLCAPDSVELVCVPESGTRFPVGDTTVTCTATDAAGNTSQCTFIVMVKDTEAPMLLCPPDITVNSDSDSCSATVDYVTTATDLCSTLPVELVCTPMPGSLFPVGTTPVTCIATDASGNQTSCTFSVKVLDTIPPVIVCPANVDVTASGCDSSATVSVVVPQANDNCAGQVSVGPAVRSDGQPLAAPFPLGTTTVTWTATDAAGNTASCSITVTVQPGDCPVPIPCEILCPEDIVMEADPQLCGAVVDYTVELTGDCEGTTIVCTPPPGSVFPIGTTIVHCHVVFPTGHPGTSAGGTHENCECVFAVTVRDITPPQITCPSDTIVIAEPGECDALVNYTVTASDLCTSAVQISCYPPSGTRFPIGTTTVVCAATDASGNTSYCSFKVTVRDTTPPQIACPPNVEVTASGCNTTATVNLPQPQATDDCTPHLFISAAIRSDGRPLTDPFPIGTTTVTWTVTDASGNTASCTTLVTVHPGDCPVPNPCPEPPQITCPADILVTAQPGKCVAVVNYQVTATDDCTTDLQVICTPPSGSTFSVGVTVVTCTVTDGSGQSSSCSFKVTVADQQAPQIACPSNIVVDAEAGRCDAVATWQVSATDACTTGVRVACYPPSGFRFPVGVTTVFCVATDVFGNSAECSFTVTVRDRQKPVITCPADITVDAMTDCCDAVVNYPVTATDNCGGVVAVVCTPPSGSSFKLGTTPVVCIATDASGNTARCTFLVTVRDTQAPVINCPDDMIVNTEDICCEAVVDYKVTAIDNCGGEVDLVCTPPPGSMFPLGLNTVTCVATDASGNQTTCSFLIDVCDHVLPVISCPADVTVKAPDCANSVRISLSIPTATDNCSTAPLITRGVRSDNKGLGDPYPVGLTTVTWAAVDQAGNVATCSTVIEVLPGDCVPCTITCPANITVNAETGRGDAVVTFSPTTTGNCNGTALSCSPASGTRFPIGSTTVTCKAVIPGGNTTQCSFTVTVVDTQAPIITCPDGIAVTASQCETSASVDLPEADVSDNSGHTPVVVSSRSDGQALDAPFPAGTTIVTITATDASGNSASCTVNVTVTPGECPQPVGGCISTMAQWEANPQAWPVNTLSLGNRTYTKAELQAILNHPVSGNRLVRLAHQLIAAKLNVANGANPSAVSAAIADADTLIADKVVPPHGTDNLLSTQTANLHITLGRYNQGLIGPGSCTAD